MDPDFKKYKDGLLPCIVQDNFTSKVLMLGFMNQEAFIQTKTLGRVTFFSRSKDRLWTKGETSGNFLNLVDMRLDCDQDSLLIKVHPVGPVCHTGADTCFNESNEKDQTENFISILEGIIASRKVDDASASYTNSLFRSGINKIAQKVGEEAVEMIIEAKDDNLELFKNEAADLLFHYMVLLQAKGCCINDIADVLEKRHVKG